MESLAINHMATFMAAISMFVIGGFWFSPLLFGNRWMQELNVDSSFIESGNPKLIFGCSFLLSLLMSYNLSAFVSGFDHWMWGVIGGILVGLGWVAASLGILYLFERRSMVFYLINAGYFIVSFVVMGLIIGIWK